MIAQFEALRDRMRKEYIKVIKQYRELIEESDIPDELQELARSDLFSEFDLEKLIEDEEIKSKIIDIWEMKIIMNAFKKQLIICDIEISRRKGS